MCDSASLTNRTNKNMLPFCRRPRTSTAYAGRKLKKGKENDACLSQPSRNPICYKAGLKYSQANIGSETEGTIHKLLDLERERGLCIRIFCARAGAFYIFCSPFFAKTNVSTTAVSLSRFTLTCLLVRTAATAGKEEKKLLLLRSPLFPRWLM